MAMPWYEQAAEINNAVEREAFIKGSFGFQKKDHSSLIAGLFAGYIGAQIAMKGNPQRD